MKPGDLVRYREWRAGDVPRSEVPLESQAWESVGIVQWVGHDMFCGASSPAATYLNEDGEMILAAQRDLEVINESR